MGIPKDPRVEPAGAEKARPRGLSEKSVLVYPETLLNHPFTQILYWPLVTSSNRQQAGFQSMYQKYRPPVRQQQATGRFSKYISKILASNPSHQQATDWFSKYALKLLHLHLEQQQATGSFSNYISKILAPINQQQQATCRFSKFISKITQRNINRTASHKSIFKIYILYEVIMHLCLLYFVFVMPQMII
jgi:hypothetical protein